MEDITYEHVAARVKQFGVERDWEQYHNGKDLALSLTLEAAELLEHFQWVSAEEAAEKNLEGIKEELSDVLIYAMQIADTLGIDLLAEADRKIDKNAMKYPKPE